MIYNDEKVLGIFEDYIDISFHLDWIKNFKNRKVFYFINIHNKSPEKIKLIEQMAALNIVVMPAMKYTSFPCDFILADPNKMDSHAFSFFNNNEKFIFLWNKHNKTYKLKTDRKAFFLFTTYKQLDDFLQINKIHSVQFSSRYFPEFVYCGSQLTLSVIGHSLGYTEKDEIKTLQNQMEKSFNPHLPTISILNDDLLRIKTVKNSLETLSNKFNIIVLSDYSLTFVAKNILCATKKMKSYVSTIVKANLISIFSEDLIDYCMQGVPTIPVYTRYLDSLLAGGIILPSAERVKYPKKRFITFTELFLYNNTSNEFLMYLNPIDIEDTEFLSYLIKNNLYWKNFNNKIKMICNKQIGMYFPHYSKKTSDTIIKILKHEDLKIVRRTI